jgi:hypothetical protein
MQTLTTQQISQGMDDDLEVASTSLRLPLECPATRIRMKLPGRATTCKHVHCFDIEGYLRMNEKKPSKFKQRKMFFFYSFFFLFQLGFVLSVINQPYILIYLLINFLLILLENVHRIRKRLNMKQMDNGKQLEKKNFHEEHNVKKKHIKQQRLVMENLRLIRINQMIMIQKKNKHILVSVQ